MKYPVNAACLYEPRDSLEEFGGSYEFPSFFWSGCILDRLNHCLSGAVVDTDLGSIIDKSEFLGHICQRPIYRNDDARFISCLSSKLASQAHQYLMLNDEFTSAIQGLVGGLQLFNHIGDLSLYPSNLGVDLFESPMSWLGDYAMRITELLEGLVDYGLRADLLELGPLLKRLNIAPDGVFSRMFEGLFFPEFLGDVGWG